MLNNYVLHKIIDLGDTKVFSASVLPCITIFSLGKTTDCQKVSFTSIYAAKSDHTSKCADKILSLLSQEGCFKIDDEHKYIVKQGYLRAIETNEPWTLSTRADEQWLKRVQMKTYKTFGDIGKIRVGIKTTADDIFISSDWQGSNADIECLYPLITHRNAGQIIPNSKPLSKVLYTHIVINKQRTAITLDDYPNAKKYLLQHYERLSSRHYIQKANRNWYEIWIPRNPSSWKHRKIIFKDIADKPQFWLDETGAIVNGDCYWIDIFPETAQELIYLALAVANSTFIEKFYDVKFNTKLYSGKRRYMTQYVKDFPLPNPKDKYARQAINIIKKIITENTQECALSYKNELDVLVEKCFSIIHINT